MSVVVVISGSVCSFAVLVGRPRELGRSTLDLCMRHESMSMFHLTTHSERQVRAKPSVYISLCGSLLCISPFAIMRTIPVRPRVLLCCSMRDVMEWRVPSDV